MPGVVVGRPYHRDAVLAVFSTGVERLHSFLFASICELDTLHRLVVVNEVLDLDVVEHVVVHVGVELFGVETAFRLVVVPPVA